MSKSVEIGLRLRAARKAANYRTASAFAEQNSIPISTYSQHENGKRVLNADVLLQYSELLEISPGWLLSGTGHPFIDTEEAEQKIDVLERELFSLDKTAPSISALNPIDKGQSWVDVDLLRKVMLRFVPLFDEMRMAISDAELTAFVFEVYNGVVMTSASLDDKTAMIDLSIASLRRGALKQNAVPLGLAERVSA